MKKCKFCGKDLVRNPKWSVAQWNKAKFCNRECMGYSMLGMKYSHQARKNMSLAQKALRGISDDEAQFRKKVRRLVQTALRSGVLKKGICKEFNLIINECKGRIEGHHADYKKPLDITWLCTLHHLRLHHRLWNN